MATYTGTADANGDFNISFGGNSYISAQKVTVTAAKDGATKSIELFAPSDTTGGGVIQFSGSLSNFPTNIGTVTITELTSVGNSAFASSSTGTFMQLATGLNLSNSITSIGIGSFQGWSSMQTLTISQNITQIPNNAFRTCSALLEINLHEGITLLGQYAFQGASSCTKVTLPSTLATLQAFALASLSNCNEMVCLRSTPPAIASDTLSGLKSTCVIKVPIASLTAYQTAANWSAHASKMVGV